MKRKRREIDNGGIIEMVHGTGSVTRTPSQNIAGYAIMFNEEYWPFKEE